MPAGRPEYIHDLSLPRSKPRSLTLSLCFRVSAVLRRLLGGNYTLRLLLDFSWASQRAAYHVAGSVLGPPFHMSATALTDMRLVAELEGVDRVLDVGCGRGRWSSIAARVADVTGVDHDPASLELAQVSCPSGRFFSGGIEDVLAHDLSGEHFDVALLVHVLEHVEDPNALLGALQGRVDRLIIEVPDFEADPLNVARVALARPYWWDADHVREYTGTTLDAHLGAAGWKVASLERRWAAMLVVAVPASSLSHANSSRAR